MTTHALKPVYCAHPKVTPPSGVKKSDKGFLIVRGVQASAVVTAPWCDKDHFPEA